MTRTKSVILAFAALLISPIAANASPGGVDDGLRVWLKADELVSVSSDLVVQWGDSSGNSNDAIYNSANTFGEQPPVYVASNPAAANSPTVRFLGQNALEIDLQWLAGSDYTIFVVNGRNRFGLANFYLAGDSLATNQNLVLGYEQVGLLRQAHFNNDLDALVAPYVGRPLWALDTFRFEQALGRSIFQDGSLVASDNNQFPLISNTGSTLGHFRAFGSLFWFQGDLAEVVVYDRALTDDERLLVEVDLAGRYGRPLSVNDYVPCIGGWGTHGDYVDALTKVVKLFRDAGLVGPREAGMIVAQGGNSACGSQ